MQQIDEITNSIADAPFTTSPEYTNDPTLVGAFVANAKTAWDWLFNIFKNDVDDTGTFKNLISQLNLFKTQANAQSFEVNNAKNDCIDAKNEAIAKALEIKSYIIPTEATYDAATIDSRIYDSSDFAQHGLIPHDEVNEIRPQDMFTEVNVTNVLRLSNKAKTYKVRFTDGVYNMDTSDFILPKAPFATSSTDELLDDSVNGLTTQNNHSKGDIVVHSINDAYIATEDTTAGELLSGSIFKAIPYVTKQVALLIEKTSAGAILNTVKPLVNMYGEESVLTYEADIFAELGCSQVSDRVWTDGSSEFILVGLKGYNNSGSYDYLYNAFGSRNYSDNLPWHSTTVTRTSTYDTFNNRAVLTTSGRPDSKIEDKCYVEGQGGLIVYAIPNAKTPTYKHMEEVKRNLVDGYIETRSDVTTHGTMTVVEELTDTSKTLWTLTLSKAIEVYQVLYTTDSGVTWNTETFTHDNISNQITLGTTRTDILVSYKAHNQSAIPVSTPQPIEVVDRDLIASNHHSVHAYNGLTYASTGKVATGSSVESKGVEDYSMGHSGIITSNSTVYLKTGHVYYVKDTASEYGDGYFELVSVLDLQFTFGDLSSTDIDADTSYLRVGLPTTPTHNTINLDANSIVGSKALVTQTSDALQVFTQEMIWDYDADSFGFGISVAYNASTSFIVDTYYVVTGSSTSDFGGTWLCIVAGTYVPANLYTIIENGKKYLGSNNIEGIATKFFQLWDGNGFGDTNEFDQLAPGTDVDLNGNTIQTKVLLKPSSIKTGE